MHSPTALVRRPALCDQRLCHRRQADAQSPKVIGCKHRLSTLRSSMYTCSGLEAENEKLQIDRELRRSAVRECFGAMAAVSHSWDSANTGRKTEPLRPSAQNL